MEKHAADVGNITAYLDQHQVHLSAAPLMPQVVSPAASPRRQAPAPAPAAPAPAPAAPPGAPAPAAPAPASVPAPAPAPVVEGVQAEAAAQLGAPQPGLPPSSVGGLQMGVLPPQVPTKRRGTGDRGVDTKKRKKKVCLLCLDAGHVDAPNCNGRFNRDKCNNFERDGKPRT
jgi:hypothetical protein